LAGQFNWPRREDKAWNRGEKVGNKRQREREEEEEEAVT